MYLLTIDDAERFFPFDDSKCCSLRAVDISFRAKTMSFSSSAYQNVINNFNLPLHFNGWSFKMKAQNLKICLRQSE
jgi:hypothetical protein